MFSHFQISSLTAANKIVMGNVHIYELKLFIQYKIFKTKNYWNKIRSENIY